MRLQSKQIIIGMITFFMVTSLLLTGCNSEQKTSGENKEENKSSTTQFKPLDTKSKTVIAEYQGGKITEGQLNEYLNILAFLDFQVSMMLSDPKMKAQMDEFKRIILKGFAAELMIAKEVKKDKEYGEKAEKEMKNLEQSLKQPMIPMDDEQKPPKNLAEAIQGKGFTKDGLKMFIIRNLQRNDYFKDQMKGKKYDKVKVNHILVAFEPEGKKKRSDAEAKKRADEVKKKLESGEDFKKLAKQYSDDPGSKDKGGLVEGSADQFVPEFAKMVRTHDLNKISDPIKTEYGYHIVKVLERSEEDLDKAPEEVKQQKIQQLNQEYIDTKLKINIVSPQLKEEKKDPKEETDKK